MARAAAPARRSGSQFMGVEKLPPANCAPYSFGSSGAWTMCTVFQSASSSSAMIIGSEVLMPCPISGTLDMMVMVLSGAMRHVGIDGRVVLRMLRAVGRARGQGRIGPFRNAQGQQHAAAGGGADGQEGATGDSMLGCCELVRCHDQTSRESVVGNPAACLMAARMRL